MAAVFPAAFALLSVEGHTVGALFDRRIGLVRADLNALQRAVILASAVMLALGNRAFDRTICAAMTIHCSDLLHYGVHCSLRKHP